MKILVLDTETLGVAKPRVYDLGWLIYDTTDGTTIVARDYLAKEIFDNKRLMQTAYYKNKKPLYEKMLADGKCKKVGWAYICRILSRDINKYKPDGIYAYNSNFDNRSMKVSCEELKVKNPTADGIIDIWRGIVNPLITKSDGYREFCIANGYMSRHKTPRVQENAEVLYRYITGQTDFEEKHMALDDSRIELEILLHALGMRA